MIRKLLYFFRSIFLNFSESFGKITFKPGFRLLCLGIFMFMNIGYSQIMQRGASTASTTANNVLKIDKPNNVVAGDLMIVNIAQVNSINANALSNPISTGWTLIKGASLTSSGNPRWGAVLYKIATASEPLNYTFTLDLHNNGGVGAIVAFSGVDLSGSPFYVTSSGINTANSGTASATTITPTSNYATIIMFAQAANSAPTWTDWNTASPGALTELYDEQNTVSGNGNSTIGAAWGRQTTATSTTGTVNLSSIQRNGAVLVGLKPLTYKSQIISINAGATTWCPGETRNVDVVIKNVGTATWTDGASGSPDINIGIKWNTSGTSWTDYHSRVDAGNLVPGVTRTYTLPITASNNDGSGYSTAFAGGTSNNLIFDVVYEGPFWFASNTNGAGPGNTFFTSPVQTILAAPSNKTIAAANSSICSGSNTNIAVALSELGVNYQLRDASNTLIGSVVAGTNGTINLPTGNLTGTTSFNVLASSCGNSVQMPGTVTVNVSQPPTISNAGPDQTASSSSFTLAANTPTVGTGVWSVVSGPNTNSTQFSSTTNPLATFNRTAAGTYILRWTISNGSVCSTSTDDVIIANCVNNLITNGDFANGTTGWSPATSVPGSVVEINPENTYFSTSNGDNTAELDSGASLRQTVTVVPNVPYTVTFLYAKRPGTPDTSVAVDVKIIGGSNPTSKRVTTSNTTNPVTDSFTFTPTSSSISIEFYNSLATTTYGAIIDNIVLLPSSQVVPIATTIPKGTYKTLTACVGASVPLDVENVPASGITYQWSTTSSGAGFSSATNIKSPTVIFTTTGLKEFKVLATTAGGCVSSSSSTFVYVIAAPVVFTVTGGGSYCTGGTGVTVGLNGSISGISYQLQKDGANIGTAIIATGSAINFGLQTLEGSYTVVARNTAISTSCTSNMSGTATVTINPLPTISGTLSVCIGSTTSLIGSGTKNASNPWISSSTTVASVSNTGLVTGKTAGTTVITYTNNNGCSITATVTVGSLPAITVGTITDVSCASLGSVVLSNLPLGNWKINQTGFAAASIDSPTNSTTTYTVTGLAAGSYYFTVSIGSCASPQTAIVNIGDQPTTIWDGNSWSNGDPDDTKKVLVTAAFPNQPFTSANLFVNACSLIITSTDDVIVPSGVTLTITNAVKTNGKLEFKNNSSLIQTNNDPTINSGNISYERISTPIFQKDYIYWSSPVKNQKLADLSPGTDPQKFYYNDGTNWVFVDRENTMDIGKGYIIRGPLSYNNSTKQTFTAVFKGVPNNGSLEGELLSKGKYHFIGNPYPSALNADALISQNTALLNGTIYFWTHNTPINLSLANQYTTDDYATYNLSGGVSAKSDINHNNPVGVDNGIKPTGKIAAGQSFFVSTRIAGKVQFNNTMRVGGANNGQFFKSGNTEKEVVLEKNRIWLNMTNDKGAFKQLLVGYIEGATNFYENRYDGITFDGNAFLDFYSVNNGNKFVIQGRALPFDDSDIVPLGYRAAMEGAFTISIDEVDGKMVNQPIYIEDKVTGEIHDLRTSNYTFKTAIGTFTDRLILRYTGKTLGTGDFENTQDGILISVKNKVINVLSSKENIKEVSIFDITGKTLYSKTKVSNTELQVQNLQSGNQVLLVKVTLDNDFTTTRKIIFQ